MAVRTLALLLCLVACASAFAPTGVPALRTSRASSCAVRMSGGEEEMTRREFSLTYPAIVSIPFWAILFKTRAPSAEPAAAPKAEAPKAEAPKAEAPKAPAAAAPPPAPKAEAPKPAPTPAPAAAPALAK